AEEIRRQRHSQRHGLSGDTEMSSRNTRNVQSPRNTRNGQGPRNTRNMQPPRNTRNEPRMRKTRNALVVLGLCVAARAFAAGDGLDPAKLLKPLGEEWTSY